MSLTLTATSSATPGPTTADVCERRLTIDACTHPQFGAAREFSTTLVGPFLVTTYTFLHNGIIHPTANESWSVAGGTIKFSIG